MNQPLTDLTFAAEQADKIGIVRPPVPQDLDSQLLARDDVGPTIKAGKASRRDPVHQLAVAEDQPVSITVA